MLKSFFKTKTNLTFYIFLAAGLISINSCIVMNSDSSSERPSNNSLSRPAGLSVTYTQINASKNQFILKGTRLNEVTQVRLTGSGVNEVFDIDSQSATEILVSARRNIGLVSDILYNLVLTSALGNTSYNIAFTAGTGTITTDKLVDGSVTAVKMHSMGATTGQFLRFNGTNWAPSSSITLDNSGNFDLGATPLTNISDVNLTFSSAAGNSAAFSLGEDDDNRADFVWDNTDGSLHLSTSDNGTDYTDTMVFNNGKLGIGTPIKDSLLTLNAQNNTLGQGLKIGTTAPGTASNGNISGITFAPNGFDLNRTRAAIYAISTQKDVSPGYAAALVFATRGAADGSEIATTDERMRITKEGYVGIGTTGPNDALDVVGDIDVTGCFQTDDTTTVGGTCVSDERLKTEIRPLSGTLMRLLSLRPVSYIWRPEFQNIHHKKGKEIGLIAQEVEDVFPEMVKEKEDGYKRVTYGVSLQIRIIESIKEFYNLFVQDKEERDREIASIQEDKEKLETKVNRLEDENLQMRKYLCDKFKDANFCQ
jgi:hypothetical protein